MKLTDDERNALERWRECRNEDEAEATVDALRLMGLLLRLFPVRTYGDLVIRWDDPITPERLVACGFVQGDMCVAFHGIQFWLLSGHWWINHYVIPSGASPRNMLEVWNLMERCGINESECEHGMLP